MKQAGVDRSKGVPLVRFTSTSYKHPNPKFGTIHNPVFEVVGWNAATASAVGDAAPVTPVAAAVEPEMVPLDIPAEEEEQPVVANKRKRRAIAS